MIPGKIATDQPIFSADLSDGESDSSIIRLSAYRIRRVVGRREVMSSRVCSSEQPFETDLGPNNRCSVRD